MGKFKTDFLSEKCHLGNVSIYLGYSDLDGLLVESCRQIVDNKVPFWVISVNHSEGGKVQTQSRKSAEKYFFKCPIKTQQKNIFSNVPLKPQKICIKKEACASYFYKTPRVGLEPTTLRLTAECSAIELPGITLYTFDYNKR